jgi:hypothetical protein
VSARLTNYQSAKWSTLGIEPLARQLRGGRRSRPLSERIVAAPPLRQEVFRWQISPFRRRMIEDMTVRNLSQRRNNRTSMRYRSSIGI